MGKYFADIHAWPDSQLGGAPCDLHDTPEVAELRRSRDYDGLISFGKALCFQLRYHEAIEAYSNAISLRPEKYEGYRQRAARYLATLQAEKAILDFLHCRTLGGDEIDLSYRLGICYYLNGEYAQAMEELKKCHSLCDEEMGIAAIFWHTLSAWRIGMETTLLDSCYHPGMDVGHHTAYEAAMSTAAGYIDVSETMARLEQETDDLEYSICAYGVAKMLLHREKKEEANILLQSIVRRDSFWICYAYLAAWNDLNKTSEER